MNMDFGLFQQQSMKLIMTNELRQAITLLQYSAIELNNYLQELQLENPLIEIEVERERHKLNGTISFRSGSISRQGNNQNNEYSTIDHLSEQEEGLQDHLLNQIRLLKLDKKRKRIVTYLTLSVDENGYLPNTPKELAEELQEPIPLIEEALQILQSLEPSGVGATSLKDCLLIQLRQLQPRDLLAEKIVEKQLDYLGNKQFKHIAKEENTTIEEVQHIFDFIQTLNPKPGAYYHHEPTTYVKPDVTVKKVKSKYLVFLNEEFTPKMMMNRQYAALIREGETEVSQYMQKKYEQFQWIKKSIEQRQETLLKVTNAIVEEQQAFLEHGPTHIQPLTLKRIADKLDIHESTVSRATTKKYVQTPKGLFELKYFFTSAVGGKGKEQSSSSERVKIYLKQCIDKEDKKKPLSDQKLANLLEKEHDIHVSRRTVAKYREEMHIPSSAQRKRFN